MRAAAVPVDYRVYAGMIHGYFGLDSVFPIAADAMHAAGDALRAGLALQPSVRSETIRD